jgi:CDGSH-type Zn-finger protein
MSEIKIKDTKPIKVDLEEGKHYAWCACGHTSREVFCDGSHKKLEGVSPVIFKAEKTESKYLCQCKQTKTPPYCDGTHKTLNKE